MDKRVFELLKLTEGADPVPAVEALIASAADLTAKLAEANDARAKIEAVAKAGVDETAKLAERVKALEDEKRGAEVEAFIADLANKNLITPAQKDSVRALAVKELDAARAIFKDAKPVIALGAVGSDSKADVLPESPSLRFTELVRREMAKGKSYDAAEVAVLAENPGLFKAMNDERRPPADA
jgi:phage I-like protein